MGGDAGVRDEGEAAGAVRIGRPSRDDSPKPKTVSNGAQLPKIQSHTSSLAAVAVGGRRG